MIRRAHPEQDIQKAIVAYLCAVVVGPCVVHAIPNASRRTPSGRAGNAVPGLLQGIPDLALVVKGRAYYFEVKASKGRLSEYQEAAIEGLRRAGARVAVVRSIDEVQTWLAVWRIPTRLSKQGREA